jgi:hypothetical protein
MIRAGDDAASTCSFHSQTVVVVVYTFVMAKKKSPKRTSKPTMISFRAPDDLLPKLDAYVASLSESVPGGSWTRSSAALNLISMALKGREGK